MSASHPADAPPTYEDAVGSSAPTPGIRRVSTDGPGARTARNGIPPEHRRSMEDENRELPPGWIRQFDPQEQHQFFVDTRANPPRSIWTHPYDDEDFLATLSPEERKTRSRLHRSMTLEDLAAEDTDNEDDSNVRKHTAAPGASASASASSSNAQGEQPKGLHKFGRKMKDALTSTTHAERETQRTQRAEQERQAYIAHLRTRQAMVRALETGQPQLLGTDRQGREVYIEPPPRPQGYGGFGGYSRGGYGYSPFGASPFGGGMYANPNSRYLRPVGPYPYGGRRGGYGYGGGIGAPVAAGFLGGAVLGGLMF